MRKTTTIIISKAAIFFLDKLGRGTAFPGKIALIMDKYIMNKIKIKGKVIIITGSSGKGSTSSLIAKILRGSNYSVTFNDGASNLTNGILTTLLKDTDFKGVINSDFLVLEIDERYVKEIAKVIKPDYLLITNITRDQSPRNVHFDNVANEIKKGLHVNTHLILNCDDPYSNTFITNRDKVTLFGIEKTKYSYPKKINKNLNMEYCPKCNNKLNYEYYHVESYGKFNCENCSFKREKPHYQINSIDFESREITINNKYKTCIKDGILHSAYTALGAFSVCGLLGIDLTKITNEMNSHCKNYKNDFIIKYKNINIYNLFTKNENSSTFNYALTFVDRIKDKKNVVIGWSVISRRYDYKDISWIYDIDFEILKNHDIKKLICFGPNSDEIEQRFILAGFDKKMIIKLKDTQELLKYIVKNPKVNFYNIVDSTYSNKKIFKNFSEYLYETEKKLGDLDD